MLAGRSPSINSVFSFILIALQDILHDLVSVVAAYNLILLGLILLIIGLAKFLEAKWRTAPNIVLLGVSITLYAYFTFAEPNRDGRDCVFNAMIALLYAQAAWLLFRYAFPEIRAAARITALVCLAFAAGGLLRIVLAAPLPLSPPLPGRIQDPYALIAYLLLGVSLSFGLALLVSGRMRGDIQSEAGRFQKFFSGLPHAIVVCRLPDQIIIDANSRMEKLTGYLKEEMIGKTMADLNMTPDQEDHQIRMHQLKLGREIVAGEFALRRKDQSVITVLCSAAAMNLGGGPTVFMCLNDVSEIIHIKKQPPAASNHDQLTGLTNRTLLYDRYEMAMAHAQRSQKKLAIAMIGLDAFQDINDTYGQAVGDKLLIQASRRIARFSRKEDTVARLRGDEFVILMTHVKNRETIDQAFKRVLHAFRVPFVVNGEAIKITLSIGIALHPDHGVEINDLVRKADIAMSHVKKNGKNNLRFYEPQPENNPAE